MLNIFSKIFNLFHITLLIEEQRSKVLCNEPSLLGQLVGEVNILSTVSPNLLKMLLPLSWSLGMKHRWAEVTVSDHLQEFLWQNFKIETCAKLQSCLYIKLDYHT